MAKKGKNLQVLYEIAMSIGSSLDLEEMTQTALFAYVEILDCGRGIVVKNQTCRNACSEDCHCVFSLPDVDSRQTMLLEAQKEIAEFIEHETEQSGSSWVRRVSEAEYSHVMRLPDYGFLVLFRKDHPLDQEVLERLIPLNRKFASSCIACENKASLAESEARYRRIFESIEDVYAEIDVETSIILEISPSVVSILEYTREELLGFNSRALYVDDRERLKLKEYLLTDGVANDFEVKVWTKSGKQKTVSLSVRVEPNDSGGLRAVGTMRDISRRKKVEETLLQTRRWLEEEVQQRTAKLHEANESLKAEIQERIEAEKTLKQTQTKLIQSEKLAGIGQLASGIAHEINTPIQYIGTHIRFLEGGSSALIDLVEEVESLLPLLEDAGLTEPAKALRIKLEDADFQYLKGSLPESLQHATEGVEQITSIVRGMNLFAHTGNHDKSSNSINEIIGNVLKISNNEWKGIIRVDLELEDNLPEVCCVRHAIGQVLLNLLINSVHAIQERLETDSTKPGVIRIRTTTIDDDLMILLRDNGVGIPEDKLNRIFDPFFTTKPPGKGTGQGLAIANSIVVGEHKGSIDVRSEPGEWTEFEIRLPLYTEDYAD